MNFGGAIRLNKCGTCILITIVIVFILYLFKGGESALKRDEQVDLRLLLIGSIEAAIAGGIKVVQVHNSTNMKVRSKGRTKEGANDPVTDADLQSHCAMYYSLTHAFPVKVISEEQKSSESDCPVSRILDLDPNTLNQYHVKKQLVPAKDITVWIDPLDATQEFTENLLEYVTTLVCVAVNGKPILGIIHAPFTGATVWAWVGQSLQTPPKASPKSLKIITSRSHQGDVTQVVKKVFGENVEVIPAGGAGYKSLQVASGNASAYIHTTHIKKWDICAGDALLRSLGGRMTTLHGEDIDYSAKTDVVNKDGLLATLNQYDWFSSKLTPYWASSR